MGTALRSPNYYSCLDRRRVRHIVGRWLCDTHAGDPAHCPLLAFAAAPLVKTLQRVMPRFLAILIVSLLVFSRLSLLLYTIVRTAIEQGPALPLEIQHLFSPAGQQQLKALERPLIALGIPPDQLAALPQQILSH